MAKQKQRQMTKFEKLQCQAENYRYFLEEHPAIMGNTLGLFPNLYYSVQKCSKLGYSYCHGRDMQIFYNSKKAEMFRKRNPELSKKLWAKEFKECEEDWKDIKDPKLKRAEKALATIHVSYEELFGESWAFDHIEYWGELCFRMFEGKKTNDLKESMSQQNWGRYSGVETGGNTFEEMLIKVAKEFKKKFGNFKADDFLTKKEIENHEKEEIFLKSKRKKDKEGRVSYLMKSNPKWIRIEDAELNRRWVKWFSKTDYCKKNWKDNVRAILVGKRDI